MRTRVIPADTTILMVDDDPDILAATEATVRSGGYATITGATAAEAVALAKRHRPALLLLDVVLPDGNGVEVAKRLKQDPSLEGLFVVLLSGERISGEDQTLGLHEGLADGYITKPIARTELLARIESFLRIHDAQAHLRASNRLLAQAEAIGHVGSWRVGLLGGEQTWSDESVRILGVDPSASEGDWLEVVRTAVHPKDRERFDSWVAAASMLDGPSREDFRIVRPDGEVRWVCAHGAVELGDSGEAVALAGILHDVTDSKHVEEERVDHLTEAANVDRLTGLHNLRGFDLVAEQVIAQAQRARQGVGLIFCDMDGLKAINDAFGHVQGDRALIDTTSILKFTLRSADAIARIGGDEFVVLTLGSERSAILHLNERLQEGFDFFNATNERPYRLSLSSGTAWCEPGEPCRLEELKATADSDMYAEKLRRRRSR